MSSGGARSGRGRPRRPRAELKAGLAVKHYWEYPIVASVRRHLTTEIGHEPTKSEVLVWLRLQSRLAVIEILAAAIAALDEAGAE